MKNKKIIDISLITIFWLLSIYIINPLGNFPISDDFSYVNTVKRLFDTGEFKPHYWTSMTLFSQAYIGYFFSLIFNYSIEKLRILVSILGLIGIIFTYLIAYELKIERKIRLFLIILIGFNPIYLHHSLTFMTDIPFFALASISLYCFIKCLDSFSIYYWIIAIFFAIISILTRQIGMFLPIAFGITILLKEKFGFKNLIIALIPITFSALVYIFYVKWLEISGIKPSFFGTQGGLPSDKIKLIIHLTKNLISNIVFFLLHISLFIIPIVIIYFKKIYTISNKKVIFISVLFSILTFLILLFIYERPIPINKYNLYTFNFIGPFEDSGFHKLPPNNYYILFCSFSSIIGLIFLFIFIINLTKHHFTNLFNHTLPNKLFIFLVLCLFFYQVPLLAITVYDRYLLIPIVLISFLILTYLSNHKINFKASSFLISLFVLITISINSVITKRDFMTHNRLRWNILNELIKKGVSPYEISGGFTYYGVFCDSFFVKMVNQNSSFEKNLKYYITIRPNKNMKILSKHPFNTIYKIGDSAFYVCEKIEK